MKIGDFETRLTKTEEERRQVRQLRYKCFCEEGASATAEQTAIAEEFDRFDEHAQYMVVLHEGKIVGTYRLIDREIAQKCGGFYTETEFNIDKIKQNPGNIAETSRSCVHPDYRARGTVIRLLWLGLGEYVRQNKVSLVFGVPDWFGNNPRNTPHAISYIYHNHLAPPELRATVIPDPIDPTLNKMDILPADQVDKEKAMAEMTPLLKGYIRAGAVFGDGVFIDRPFNTYDVFAVMVIDNVADSYKQHFIK